MIEWKYKTWRHESTSSPKWLWCENYSESEILLIATCYLQKLYARQVPPPQLIFAYDQCQGHDQYLDVAYKWTLRRHIHFQTTKYAIQIIRALTIHLIAFTFFSEAMIAAGLVDVKGFGSSIGTARESELSKRWRKHIQKNLGISDI